MYYKRLNNTDLDIAPVIFGGNVFGWTLDERSSFDILDHFLELGFNAVDTSNNYSHWVPGNVGGESETIIGNYIATRNNRDKIILMTKVGGRFGYESKPNNRGVYIKEQVEHSLKRLKTDYIDLYQTHYDDEVTAVEEVLRAYDDLIKEGKVRYIGASNISPERLVESLDLAKQKKLPSYITLQPEYNLFDRDKFENLYQNVAREQDLAVIPYYALASGFLTGKYSAEHDFNLTIRGKGIKDKYWNEKGRRIISLLNELAQKYNVSNAAIALNWLLNQDTIFAPIASGTKYDHLNSFLEAVNLELEADDLIRLNSSNK